MIIKKRSLPLEIQLLEALSRRLPVSHPKYTLILENLAKKRAGYHGEKAIDYYLDFISNEKYLILQNLRLQDEKGYFQIDILIVSTCFLLILEVKNIIGTLVFDPQFHQVIRILDNKEEAFPDPLLQIDRQTTRLKTWIQEHSYTHNIPVESLVVVSNPHTIIKATTKPQLIAQKVIHSAYLPSKIKSLEILYSSAILSTKEMKKLVRYLIRKQEDEQKKPLDYYNIHPNEIIKGVQCSRCRFVPMNRQHGLWFCPACASSCKSAHIQAINDYALIISSTVTNQEIKQFLCLSSSATTKRLLSPYANSGVKKQRRYVISQ